MSDQSKLPDGTCAWILLSGKIGHEVNCLGVAHELGLAPQMRRVHARSFFEFFAPWGPIDPRDNPQNPESPLHGPLPDIVFSSGRTTVPYLRAIKKLSGGKTFTVFLQDPRIGTGAADLIWVPEHDRLRGDNVLVTPTSPHHLRPSVLAAARANPDPRLLHLPHTRIGLVLGGNSGAHRFEARDVAALTALVSEILQSGQGLMVTPSRRTPPDLMQALRVAVAESGSAERAFIWDGTGDNPYVQILAQASALVVTADSVNMVGEAASTGAPIFIYEPTGGATKMSGFVCKLADVGALRLLPEQRTAGWALERWSYPPVDATGIIAADVVRRYRAFRGF
jgi:mitochondrial fission protein ELM1